MPGPISTWEQRHDLDDGTSARIQMPAPGPNGRVRDPWTYERAEALRDAYLAGIAQAPQAIRDKVGYGLDGIVAGIIPGVLEMLAVVAATTVIGGTVGGALGFFFGGAGAIPGAVVGGEMGFDIGMAAMTWLGLGFLVVAIAQGFGELSSTISRAVTRAWAAPEYASGRYPVEVQAAGRGLADAIALLMLLIVQAILALVLKRAASASSAAAIARGQMVRTAGTEAAADAALPEVTALLRKSRLGKGFADWVEANWKDLKTDPRFRPARNARSGVQVAEEPVQTVAKRAKGVVKPQPVLANVSEASLELAAQAGSSVAQKAARREVAEAFYRQRGKDLITRPGEKLTAEEFDAVVHSHMKGIDFNKPLKVRLAPPPEQVVQWRVQGNRVGNYFAEKGTGASELGVGKLGVNKAGEIVEKVAFEDSVPTDTPILESTAAKVKDFWSIPEGRGKAFTLGNEAWVQETKGGGIQYFRGQ